MKSISDKTSLYTNREAIIELKGEIKLVSQRIDTIENNHLKHIQAQISRISWVLYSVAFMILAQVVVALKDSI